MAASSHRIIIVPHVTLHNNKKKKLTLGLGLGTYLKLDIDGRNAVSKLWEKLYFEPARGQGVLQRALTRREEAAATALAK